MKTRLLIARHGNTFNPDECARRVGTTDLPLVNSGLIQGELLGRYLKLHNMLPDIIYTSTLQRTLQTAQRAQFAMQTSVLVSELSIFNEIDYGVDENQPEDKVIGRVGVGALQAWEKAAIVPPGWHVNPTEIIQHWHDFTARLKQEHQGKTVLVVTSNGIARFSPHLTGDFAAFAAKHPIKIATGALCIFENRAPSMQWNCLGWNIRPKDEAR